MVAAEKESMCQVLPLFFLVLPESGDTYASLYFSRRTFSCQFSVTLMGSGFARLKAHSVNAAMGSPLASRMSLWVLAASGKYREAITSQPSLWSNGSKSTTLTPAAFSLETACWRPRVMGGCGWMTLEIVRRNHSWHWRRRSGRSTVGTYPSSHMMPMVTSAGPYGLMVFHGRGTSDVSSSQGSMPMSVFWKRSRSPTEFARGDTTQRMLS